MDFKNVVAARRSVRKYSDKVVEESVIEELIETALKAPSSRNSHSTHFVVVRNAQIIESMAGMRDYGSSFIKNAPIFILVTGDRNATDLWSVNCSISATFMQLAATSLGLASCWVHIDGRTQHKDLADGGMAEDVVRSLVEIPASHGILCGIAVGYSDFVPANLPDFDGAAHVRIVE